MRSLLRRTAFFGLLLGFVSVTVVAKNRNWQEAKVIKITSDRAGAAAVPVGGTIFAVPLTRVYYWVETKEVIYVLGPAFSKRQQLDVTLYGKTKIAIEGRDAHVLDDQGKDRKMHIAEKIARQNEPDSQPKD
jgi:hypothetical protein